MIKTILVVAAVLWVLAKIFKSLSSALDSDYEKRKAEELYDEGISFWYREDEDGQELPPDKLRALECWKKAAEMGNEDAKSKLELVKLLGNSDD